MATSSLNTQRLASKLSACDFRQEQEQEPGGMENILTSGFMSQMKAIILGKEPTVLFSFKNVFELRKGHV